MDIFEGLSERQREAVETIDDDLEIIACAGAGKTGCNKKNCEYS